jgi:hypothetical protein
MHAERELKPASSANACVDAVSDCLHQVKAVSARNSRKHGLMPPHGTRSRRKLANMRGSSVPAESVAGVGLKSPRVHGGSLSNCAVLKAADALCANLREAREDRKTATPLTRSNIVGPLLVEPQTARELASCSSEPAEFGMVASTSHANCR